MMDTNQIKNSQYLDSINHAPYGALITMGLILLGLFTAIILFGLFQTAIDTQPIKPGQDSPLNQDLPVLSTAKGSHRQWVISHLVLREGDCCCFAVVSFRVALDVNLSIEVVLRNWSPISKIQTLPQLKPARPNAQPKTLRRTIV